MAIHRFEYNTFLDKCATFQTYGHSSDYNRRGFNERLADTSEWIGGKNYSDVLGISRNGDASYARHAERYLERYENLALPEVRRNQWTAAPCGAYASVPDYLGSSPTPMRQRTRVISDVAPVRIYCTVACAARRTVDDMVKRHSAVLALAMVLNRVRPVELWAVSESTGGTSGDIVDMVAVRVPSTPLSISHAAVLAHPGFSRHLTYTYLVNVFGVGETIPFARAAGDGFRETQLGVTSEDIFIPMAERDNDWQGMMADPDQWIKETLERYLGAEI